jgi:hypothetical protein
MIHCGAAPGAVVVAAAGEISSPRLTLWVSDPLVPVMDNVKEPVDDEAVALTMSVEVAGVPVEGVTGLGKLAETPDGADPTQE